jgi:hypothetical protein
MESSDLRTGARPPRPLEPRHDIRVYDLVATYSDLTPSLTFVLPCAIHITFSSFPVCVISLPLPAVPVSPPKKFLWIDLITLGFLKDAPIQATKAPKNAFIEP